VSRAFVKDSEDTDGVPDLPDRAISPHRNLVTASGLERIGTEVHRLEHELVAARAAEDKPAVANLQRDLRYWNARRASAEVVPPPADHRAVRFGCTVVMRLADGSTRSLTIVGEDEANPAAGTIAYVAPVARGLLGASVGDTVETGAGQGEVIDIR
jgi:transcription elongation GreA/GreB family factor